MERKYISMESKFLVGFADVVITPNEPMPLGGYGATSHRKHEKVLEDIHAIGTAMTDAQGNTVLILTTDTTRAYFEAIPEARRMISEATGLPVEQIMITATHTHSGPDLTNTAEEAVQRYIPQVQNWLVQCAQEALADRKPARIFVGDVEATGLNFVKHYYNVTADGEKHFFGDNFGKHVMDETTRHTTEADPTMHLIRFVREGGKDVVLANWRAHPQLTGGSKIKNLSADYPAPFRQILGAQLNCHVQFLQGASGNINPKSRIPGEQYSLDHNVFGARLAYFAVKGLENNMTEVPAGMIRSKKVMLRGIADHTMDHLRKEGAEVWKYFATTGDREGTAEMCRKYGFNSVYHAGSVASKAAGPEYVDLELYAVAVGEHLAFVTAPNELFDTNSVYTEEHSPFDMTFTCGYANGHWFYIPSRYGYEYKCYEANVSRFLAGTGEQVSETFLQMLGELKG